MLAQRVLSLNVGAGKIVLAEFSIKSGRGAPELVRYGQAALSPEAEGDALGPAIELGLRSIMSETGIRPGPVLIALSGQTVFPRFVKLPAIGKDKLAQMIESEAEQNVPFPINEVIWDYALLGSAELGEQNAVIVAVKTETAKVVTDAVSRAGLNPEVVDVAPMALYNALRFNYPDLDGCSLIIDIGARSTNLVFSEDEKVFSRTIPVAGNAVTQEIARQFRMSHDEAEQIKCKHAFVSQGGVYAVEDETLENISKIVRNVMTRLHAEISRSINFYRSQQGGAAPVRVFLTGGSAVMPHMDAFFREKFQTDVQFLNPFVNVHLAASVDVSRVERDAFVLAETVGLALRRALKCPVEISLLPPEVVQKITMRARLPYFIGAAAGVMLSLGVWTVYMNKKADLYAAQQQQVEAELAKLKGMDAGLQGLVKLREADKNKALFVESAINFRFGGARTTKALRDSMLPGVWLVSIAPIRNPEGQTTGLKVVGQAFKDDLDDAERKAKAEGKTATAVELICENLRKKAHVFGGEREDVKIAAEVWAEPWLKEFAVDVTFAQFSAALTKKEAPRAQAVRK